MTLQDLQQDAYFQTLAVQRVGKTGYTAVTDYDTLIARFHKDPKIVDMDLHTLAGKLPSFWGIMVKTEGGRTAEGLYDWKDPDGSLRKKYMYITPVRRRTADGVGLTVAATTYLDEYAFEDDNVMIPSLFSSLNYTYLSVFLLGFLIYFFLFWSINRHSSDKRVTISYRLMLVFGLLLLMTYTFRLHVHDLSLVTYLARTIFVLAYMFSFYYLLTMFSVARYHLHRVVLGTMHLLSIMMISWTLFSDQVVKGAVLQPDLLAAYGTVGLVRGAYFDLLILLLILLYVVSFTVLFLEYLIRKDKRMKYFFYGFLLSLAFLIPHALSESLFGLRNPLIPLIFPVLMALLVGFALFRQGYLSYKANFIMVILGMVLLIIIATFLFNADKSAISYKTETLSQTKARLSLLADIKANEITSEFSTILNDAYITSKDPQLLGAGGVGAWDAGEKRASFLVLSHLYARLSGNIESAYLMDKNGMVLMRVPFNRFYEGKEKNYTNKPGVKDALEKDEPVISSLFRTAYNDSVFSVIVPIERNNTQQGLLRMNIPLQIILDRHIMSIGAETGLDVHLLIDNKTFHGSGSEDSGLAGILSGVLTTEKQGGVPPSGSFFLGVRGSESFIVSSGDAPDAKKLGVYESFKVGEDTWTLVIVEPLDTIYAGVSASLSRIWRSAITIVVMVVLLGILSFIILTKNLRMEVQRQTKELAKMNTTLELTVKHRTEELNEANKKLAGHSKDLEKIVRRKTKELRAKVDELERNKAAMLNILEDSDEAKNRLVIAQRKLKESMNELEKLDFQKDQFISIAAHELKTPLTSIKGFTDLLKNPAVANDKKKRQKFLTIIYNDTTRLGELISNILELSRMDIGTLKLAWEKVNLGEVFGACLPQVTLQVKAKGLRFQTHIPRSLPSVFIDKDKLIQVIRNLVNNAVHYTDKGTITLTVERRQKDIKVSVSDTGKGIPPESLEKIFERFYQVDSPLTRQIGGSGLGLSISRGFIEAMGGKIWAESSPGNGSTFSFILPLKAPKTMKKTINIMPGRVDAGKADAPRDDLRRSGSRRGAARKSSRVSRTRKEKQSGKGSEG
ncbi:MAG: hypothetical protein GXP63_04960 [DPANN group archaeon]|nr:hypothetical protein [DPANN group archaeon]